MPSLADMPTALAFWSLLTRLGEAQILLPALFGAAGWLAWRGHAGPAARDWLLATAAAALLTTVTKLAFFGWEIGYAPWDYTGLSGHAMFSAAVLPVLARVLASGQPQARQWRAVALGGTLAALVALSRVIVSAHSPIESVLGFVLGLAAAGYALRRLALPHVAAPRLLAAGMAGWMLLMPTQAPASRTHDWVQQLAVTLSGRPEPYARWMMQRDHRRALQQRAAVPAPAYRP